MDKTERNLFCSLIDPTPAPRLKESPCARFETDKYLEQMFFIPDRYQSSLLMERDVQIPTAQMSLLSLDMTPAPQLEDFPCAPSRDKPKKTIRNINAGENVKCPDCNREFETYIAMLSHIRIHLDKGSNNFRNALINKPKPEATHERNRFFLRKLTGGWTVTKNQSPKELPDMKVQEEVTASILIDMSKSTWNCQSKKSRTAEFTPTEEEDKVAAILIDMPNLIWNCESLKRRRMPESARPENKKPRIEELTPSEDNKYICQTCNKNFPSHQALGGHCSRRKMERKNAGSLESAELPSGDMKKNFKGKAKDGSHVCEICGESYPTGQQLGGHKRAHYKKVDLHDQE